MRQNFVGKRDKFADQLRRAQMQTFGVKQPAQ